MTLYCTVWCSLLTLLTRGLDPNIRGWGQWTALMWVALRGDLPCVMTLLEHGALTDIQDEDGDTALMKAALGRHLPCVQTLLKHGA